MVGLRSLGRVCAIVSAVKCVSMMIHRRVSLGQIIYYMLIKNNNNELVIDTIICIQVLFFVHYLSSFSYQRDHIIVFL